MLAAAWLANTNEKGALGSQEAGRGLTDGAKGLNQGVKEPRRFVI